MNEKQVHQLMLVKYYLTLAGSQYRLEAKQAKQAKQAKFAVLNLLHEAFETTLITLSDTLNAAVSDRATIDQYFNKIDEKLTNHVLPFRQKMMQFNRARVSAKHASTLPDVESFDSFFQTVPEFCAEAIRIAFDTELSSVNLLNLIQDNEVRTLLGEAVTHQTANQFYDGLACVRMAFFIVFEKRFDVSVFIDVDDSKPRGLLSPGLGCEAPSYAKSNRYVRENVRDPFGYVVLDHSAIDAELLKDGIDSRMFWNVWRLTPAVWRRPSGEWLVKREIDLLHGDALEDDLQYSIDGMIQIILNRQASRSRERYKNSRGLWAVRVRSGANLYVKASRHSEVRSTVPPDTDYFFVSEAVPGLEVDDWFWSAYHLKKGGPFLSGYLSFDDVEGEIFFGPNPLVDV